MPIKNPTYKRTQKQRDQDLDLIVMYLKEKMTWRDIAERINEQRPYTCNFINYYQQYWSSISEGVDKVDLDQERARQLAEVQMVKQELFDSWQRSKGIVTRTTTKGSVFGDAGNESEISAKERTIQEWDAAGETAYLTQYIKLMEREAKIWGSDAPERKEVVKTTEKKFGNLSTDEKRSLLDLIEKAKKNGGNA